MKLDFFKQENELEGLSIESLKEKIKYELLKNKEYEDVFVKKKSQYLYDQAMSIKNFLIEELKFKLTKENNSQEVYDMLFEFIKCDNEYSIEFSNKNNTKSICLTYEFENKLRKELKLNIDLSDEKYQLKCVRMWELEEVFNFGDENQEDYEAKYKNIPTESVNWYLNEYKNIKEIVENNKSIFDMIENKNISELFNITISHDEEDKEYTNIVDLIKDIIESE